MHYEINISLNGRHYFATAERSIRDYDDMVEIYKKLKKAFKQEYGYSINVTKYETIGHPQDLAF